MTEPGASEVAGDAGLHGRGVPDHQAGQQTGLLGGQHAGRRGAETGAQLARHVLGHPGTRDDLRRPAGAEHRDHVVAVPGRADGRADRHPGAGQDPGPLLGCAEQQHRGRAQRGAVVDLLDGPGHQDPRWTQAAGERAGVLLDDEEHRRGAPAVGERQERRRAALGTAHGPGGRCDEDTGQGRQHHAPDRTAPPPPADRRGDGDRGSDHPGRVPRRRSGEPERGGPDGGGRGHQTQVGPGPPVLDPPTLHPHGGDARDVGASPAAVDEVVDRRPGCGRRAARRPPVW